MPFMKTTSVQYILHFGVLWQVVNYFTLLSDGKQVDEQKRKFSIGNHSPSAQRGFLTSSPNGVRICSDRAAGDQLIRSH